MVSLTRAGNLFGKDIDDDMVSSLLGVAKGKGNYHGPEEGDYLVCSPERQVKDPQNDIAGGKQHEGKDGYTGPETAGSCLRNY